MDCGSAAARVNIGQSGLRQQLQNLEQELGFSPMTGSPSQLTGRSAHNTGEAHATQAKVHLSIGWLIHGKYSEVV